VARLPGVSPLLVLAVVLIAGILGGALARRLRLPGITGQILFGIALGPSILHLFDAQTIESLRPVTHFALGLIAVTVGNHLNLKRMRGAGKRLTLLVLLELILTPALVLGVLVLTPGASLPLALLLAAISISTAPATVIALVSETRSKGVFVKTLVAAVALNNIACISAFEVARVAGRVILEAGADNTLPALLAAPLRQIVFSVLLGGLAGVALIGATWRIVRPDHLATASILAILAVSGLADLLGLPGLLCCLFLGLVLANLTPDREEIGHRVFSNFENAILTVFFTLAGMELNLQFAVAGGLIALLVFLARMLGKVAAARLAMRLAGAPRRVQRYLGLALTPQAGLAVGLIIIVQEDPAFAAIRGLVLAVGITVVTANEIVGPILTRYALARSGDVGKDRPRLIDFLREDNIITNLRAETMEQAITRLTDLLVDSNRLQVDRRKLLRSILDRETQMPTFLGEGLAIPHGVLEEGSGVSGAMGISHEGLHFPTPDGKPVHCVLVLATPAAERDRYLEVLAAFARAIGGDKEVQAQLYSAKTPAHACELLHTEEGEDFNYFLGQEG